MTVFTTRTATRTTTRYTNIDVNALGKLFGVILSSLGIILVRVTILFNVFEGLFVILVLVKDYEIEIQKVDLGSVQKNKGLVLKVVDEELLSLTSGIVQGMSGSPIIQDGKLIGAVTHVFINDPSRGYGIFIENMLGR